MRSTPMGRYCILKAEMPIYEYRRQTCGRLFEKLRRMADADKELECPDCQAKKVDRTVSAFAMAGCGTGPGGRFT